MQSNNVYLKLNPFLLGIGLLTIPVCSLLLSSLLFVCGLSINPFVFPLSIVCSIVLMYLVSERNLSKFFSAVCYLFFIIVCSILVSAFFYDYSYDGQAYHQETIFWLKNGWNPIYETHPDAYFSSLLSHYAKGLETVSATIYSTIGNIEAGKAVNFILVFSSAFLFFAFLKTCFETLSRRKKILLTFLFTLCPVVISQILTYYIDWAAYALALILVSSLILFFKNQSKYHLFIIGFVIFFAGTIKFNLFFWILFIVFCYLVYAIMIKRYDLLKKLIVTGAISGILSVFLAAFNPYVTNTIDHKHPFYPLAGKEKVDLLAGQIPYKILDQSRFEGVVISLFSFPSNSPHSRRNIVDWALPTLLKKQHFHECKCVDLRVGGFGVFFSWILVLSTILYAMVIFRKSDGRKDKERINYHVFLALLFVSLFILPYAWWARYFPLFYAFPLVMLLYTEREKQSRNINRFRNTIYLLLIINAALFCGAVSIWSYLYKMRLTETVNMLGKSKKPVLINFEHNAGFKLKLDKENVPYQKTSEQLGTVVWTVGPAIYLDPEQYVVEQNVLIEKP